MKPQFRVEIASGVITRFLGDTQVASAGVFTARDILPLELVFLLGTTDVTEQVLSEGAVLRIGIRGEPGTGVLLAQSDTYTLEDGVANVTLDMNTAEIAAFADALPNGINEKSAWIEVEVESADASSRVTYARQSITIRCEVNMEGDEPPPAAADSAQSAADSAEAAAASAAAVAEALATKANIASPTFTGSPAAPTPETSDNSTRLATTAFVKANAGGGGGIADGDKGDVVVSESGAVWEVAPKLRPSGTAAAGDEALRAIGTSAGEACAGNDARLSDARAPTAHVHPISQVTDLASALSGKVDTGDSRLSDARTPTAHAASHGSGGSDAVTLAQSQISGLVAALAAKADASDLAAKAPLASPALTGTPTAPTATTGDASTKLATTAFVAAAIAALIGGAPGALDTLKEIADALGDDEDFAATITGVVAGKLAKASNLSDITDAAAGRTNLGVAIGSDVQAYSANLAALAPIVSTVTGRSLLAAASASAARTLLALDAVDNTADADKPISTATLAALEGKEDVDAASKTYTRTDETAKTATPVLTLENTTPSGSNVSTRQWSPAIRLRGQGWTGSASEAVEATCWLETGSASPHAVGTFVVELRKQDGSATQLRFAGDSGNLTAAGLVAADRFGKTSTLGENGLTTDQDTLYITAASAIQLTNPVLFGEAIGGYARLAAAVAGVLQLSDGTGSADAILRGLATPTANNDAAPKGYVDAAQRPSTVLVSGTTKTLALTDAHTVQPCTNAAGCTITVPPNSDVAFPIGTEILFHVAGGPVTFVAGFGVAVYPAYTLVSPRKFSVMSLRKTATDGWALAPYGFVPAGAPTVAESTIARTLSTDDVGKWIRCTNAAAITIAVPAQADVAWPDDTEVYIEQAGAGVITLTPGAGVTLNGALSSAGQYTSLGLKRVDEDVWSVIGGVES